ncbi:MAG: DUF2786 domain-containing protein [Desulfovibrio sp.]|nr:DUF2786 domain-containing protein [Desulfovibrio sp.]
MSNNERIIEKISALLAKTVEHGASKEEAIAAATMAQKLMAKYHIDQVELVHNEEISETMLKARKFWLQKLGHIVGNSLCCFVIVHHLKRRTYLKFVGRETDRKIATETYLMLAHICQQGITKEVAKARIQFGESTGVENSYAAGFLDAIAEEMSKQCQALMLVLPKEVEDTVRQKYPDLCPIHLKMKIYYRNLENIQNARTSGYNDGKTAMERREKADL